MDHCLHAVTCSFVSVLEYELIVLHTHTGSVPSNSHFLVPCVSLVSDLLHQRNRFLCWCRKRAVVMLFKYEACGIMSCNSHNPSVHRAVQLGRYYFRGIGWNVELARLMEGKSENIGISRIGSSQHGILFLPILCYNSCLTRDGYV